MNENNNNNTTNNFSDDIDSCSSTPFVSAPSSPGRAGENHNIPISSGFYFSAPSSPMHYILSTSSHKSCTSSSSVIDSSFEFDLPSSGAASADELFFNGQIRPMNVQRPKLLDTLIEEEQNEELLCRGREMMKIRAGSLRRRTRSMSPIRNFGRETDKTDDTDLEVAQGNANGSGNETTPRSSSKRWVFLKEFLYRSKSEGRKHDGHSNKFWSFSPSNKEKMSNKANNKKNCGSSSNSSGNKSEEVMMKKKVVNGNRVGKRHSVASAHEMHYTAKRAQAEEMRKRTFLPYRQGLLGCLGFSSKSFGAINGFAKVLNPPTVSTS